MASAILNAIAFLAKPGDSLVGRANALDFVADVLSVFPGEQFRRPLRIHGVSHLDWNLPFVPRFGDSWARNLRTVDDAPLRAGLGSAATLLIAGARWPQDGGVSRIDPHGRIPHDVLVNSQLQLAERTIDHLRLGQRLLKIAAALPENIDLAPLRRQNHVSCADSLPGRRLKSPDFRRGELL